MTIHAAPIPPVRALCLAAAGTHRPSWAPWVGHAGERAVEFFSAGRFALRAGIGHALERRGRSHGVVWLPDYFCDEAVLPLRTTALGLHFYPTARNLAPDWERIQSEPAIAGPPDVFVLVHYFGFRNSIDTAEAYCSTHQADLIEDCAHVLVPFSGCGEGTAVFSPRKLLAVPGGGFLATTGLAPDRHAGASVGSNKAFIAKWVARRMTQRLMLTVGLSWHQPGVGGISGRRAVTGRAQNDGVTALPDPFSQSLLHALAADLDTVSRRRRSNYLRLQRAIDGINGVAPLFPSLPDDVCPYAFPLVMPVGRDELDGQLHRCGIPSTDWPDLPPEVLDASGLHPVAIWLQEHVLLLPVHQDLSGPQVEHMARQLRSLLVTRAV